ncbi:MAG: Hpt domain-containing protein [Phycisphaerales bacterium]|nr:Hpt domain-containing protein [Phycisphaerales bacterium]
MAERDNEALRSIYRDDPEMAELIELFVGELPERVRALREFFDAGDLASLQRLAHQLRGASGGYGFEPLGFRAEQLESALKADADAEVVRKRVDELIALCSRVAA